MILGPPRLLDGADATVPPTPIDKHRAPDYPHILTSSLGAVQLSVTRRSKRTGVPEGVSCLRGWPDADVGTTNWRPAW